MPPHSMVTGRPSNSVCARRPGVCTAETVSCSRCSVLLVRYTDDGTAKVAELVRNLGRKPPKVIGGPVIAFDKVGRTITLATASGEKVTFRIVEHTLVDTGAGVVPALEYTPRAGERVPPYQRFWYS